MLVKGRWHPGHDRLHLFLVWYGFFGITDKIIGIGRVDVLLECKERTGRAGSYSGISG